MTESKLITLPIENVILVVLPEGAETPRIETNQSIIPYGQDLCWYRNGGDKSYGMDETEWVTPPPGNWQIIGMLSEVTEEMATTVVKECIDACERTTGYANYNRGDKPKPFCLDTALESLESAIEAEGYLLESPPTPKCGCFGPSEEGACPACDEWVESQSRVLDRGRCLLLGREI